MFFLRFLLLAAGLLAVLGLICVVYFFGVILYLRWKYNHLPTPECERNSLFGAMREVVKTAAKGEHFGMCVHRWAKECGSVFVLVLINKATIVCLEPSVVRELLINKKTTKPPDFYKPIQKVFGQRFGGQGLVSELDYHSWERKRKMFNPAFKRGYLKELMYQYNDSVEELISFLRMRADGKSEILMAKELNKVALDIIAKVAFGLKDLNTIPDDSAPFCTAVNQSLGGLVYSARFPYIWRLDLRSKMRAFVNETVNNIRLIRDTGKKCIMGRIEDINAGLEYPEDVLTHILKTSNNLKNSKEFGMEEMNDEFVTFFVAGQETTAQLMSFTFELAGRHPEVYRRMQEEVDTVIGKKENLTFEDISKLEYMSLVFKEVLRYTPPVVTIQRMNPEEFVINGHRIPAKSNVMLNIYAFGREERFWDEPEVFNPERFRDEDTNRHLYAYFPFSLGSRVCIGQHFAMIEAKVIIARLLQTFDYQLVPGVELQYCLEVTLKPKNRTPLYLKLRDT